MVLTMTHILEKYIQGWNDSQKELIPSLYADDYFCLLLSGGHVVLHVNWVCGIHGETGKKKHIVTY